MRISLSVARTTLSIAAGVVFASQIPVYDHPFGGCEVSGFLTLQVGCSDLPEFLRGFLFVACFALAPRQYRLPLLATTVLLVVAVFGGLPNIMTGQAEYSAIIDGVFVMMVGLPIFIGGLMAYALYVLFLKMSGKGRSAA